jgi:shikimate kinase
VARDPATLSVMRNVPLRHVVLVGLMGAGKTTVGRRLAARLGWPWHDSDADVEAATGLTVRELRDRDGLDAMHDLEAAHLLHALAAPGPSVISAAASVVDAETCRTALAATDVAVVWLRGSPAVLARRFAEGRHRPAYGTSPEDFLEQQARRRDPILRSLDPTIIDIDAIDPDTAAAMAIEALGLAPGSASIRP